MSSLSQTPLVARRFSRWFFWVSALVLVAGIVTALVVFVGNTGRDYDAVAVKTPAGPPPKREVPQKTVPLDPAARQVAGRFILTAVARENLAAAWKIAGPEIKQGLSLKEWLTGDIPVSFYPADAIDQAPMMIQESYKDSAFLEVALLPKEGSKIKPQSFIIGVTAVGKGKQRHWIVTYFAPGSAPGAYATPDG